MVKKLLWVLLLATLCNWASGQNKPFHFAGRAIKAGEQQSFHLPIKSKHGDSTFMPITIIHGRRQGPVIGIIAGIHGYEYPPIIALQQLPALLEPDKINGTIVLVHIANVAAFLGRSIYYHPVDHKNLNRVFPGKEDGTITECMAWTISRQLFPLCNFVMDVHAGDGNEDLHNYVAYVEHGQQTATAKKMAEAMGFDWVIHSPRALSDSLPTVYATSEAVKQGIPTIAIECGASGMVTKENIEQINKGIVNVLKTIRILNGTPLPTEPAIDITKRVTINSEHTGIFYSHCKSGQMIRKGMKLGYLTDLLGRHLQDVLSPVDGFIVYMVSTPPISKGELLFNLAEH